MVWTIRCDDLTTVTAFPLPGSSPALGYVTRESDKCALSQDILRMRPARGSGREA